MAMSDMEMQRLREKVELLTGERGNKAGAALRASAIRTQVLTVLVPDPRAKRIGDEQETVTAQQFNDLLDDMAALRRAIDAMRKIFL